MIFQKNPLTVVGRITHCWLFAFATPVKQARALLPPALEPVTRGDHAYFNIVISRLAHMRPKGMPSGLGVGYWHAAYRLYVRYRPNSGDAIEGLYFLRSDADSRTMVALGNLMTDFRFFYSPIRMEPSGDAIELHIEAKDAPGYVRISQQEGHLGPGSQFSSPDEAASFLKYKPAGISVGSDGSVNVVRITREEDAWRSRLVTVERQEWAFFEGKDVSFEIAYHVEPIEYQWNRATVYPSS